MITHSTVSTGELGIIKIRVDFRNYLTARTRMTESRQLVQQNFRSICASLESAGVTQRRIGRIMGRSQATVSGIMSGARPIPEDILQNAYPKLVEALLEAYSDRQEGKEKGNDN